MLLSLVYINCDYLQAQTTIPRFEEGERVVFVGNSITHGGHYHSFIWLYYMTRFPDKPITIMNAGIGGESAWDMKDRLDYDVFNRKPTYVTLTFGMNDTGYDIYMKDNAKELSEQRIAKSLESYREIEERLLAKNKIKKVLIGGSPYEAHLIDQSWSVRAAGLRQRHIDQAQSMNLYITNDYSMRQVLRLYLEAWRVGVKTIYYVRSKALEVEDCESCSS